ncbi:MAG: DEAD/DEAH box helicase [Bacteriovoracaceae bacterium]|jgi:ATP-dependent RNA helicase RhlE|nr:DEAD/DEAH box helicase [Bacteriovoracaceae bacterium]
MNEKRHAVVKFDQMDLEESILKALGEIGYEIPTPIQSAVIPELLQGKDLLGIAKTGTGKTAAFGLPILNYLAKIEVKKRGGRPRVLVLAPTRELASQIHDSFKSYGKFMKLKTSVIFGGVSAKSQVRSVEKGVDICVATPGRLLDLMSHGQVVLDQVEIFVLDEADRMLDMGFFNDVEKIITELPKDRQTLLFSATMPNDIESLSNSILIDPAKVEVTPESTPVEKIKQIIYMVDRINKPHLLNYLVKKYRIKQALVFVKTKRGADRLVKIFSRYNLEAMAIHGNKSQGARGRALKDFKLGKLRFLIATDIASRGIDVKGLSHIINYNLPLEAEAYVHRIGRTGRADELGTAISFCDELEKSYLKAIEKCIKMKIKEVKNHPFPPGYKQDGQSINEIKISKKRKISNQASRKTRSRNKKNNTRKKS